MEEIKTLIHQWALDLGFQAVGYSNLDLSEHEDYLKTWLSNGFHGSMAYMNRNQALRISPSHLLTGSISAITLRLDYLPEKGHQRIRKTLESKDIAYISRYALGRDYHKVIRTKLKRLANQINDYIDLQKLGPFYARACTDSAPILEKHLAEKSGLGWIGKNTLLLNQPSYNLESLVTTNRLPGRTDTLEDVYDLRRDSRAVFVSILDVGLRDRS